jgi:hypothetical protein
VAAAAAALRVLVAAVTAGLADAKARKRWHVQQAACGVAAWLALLVLGFAFGQSGSLSSAVLFIVLAPISLLYSVGHTALAVAIVWPESQALQDFGNAFAVMLAHGCCWHQ